MDRLRALAVKGAAAPDQALATEQALVRRSGLSRGSVRRAVDELVAEGLIERRPGLGLFVRRSSAVGTRVVQVVVPSLLFDQCVQIARGAQEAGRSTGAQVQVYDAHGSLDQDLAVLRALPASGCQGAIIVSLHHPAFASALYQLTAAGFPFVLVDERLSDLDVPSVTADDYGGGYRVGQELVRAGHRRIAAIGSLAAGTVRARFDGLRDAVIDAGLPFDRSLVLDLQVADPVGDWTPDIARCTRAALAHPQPPTALFYSSDEVAAHGYVVLKGLGVRVGDGLAVVGFDDNPIARWLDPPLTTVRQPSLALGASAMDLLVRRMADPGAPVEHRVLPVEWVRRGSLPGRTVDGPAPSPATSPS